MVSVLDLLVFFAIDVSAADAGFTPYNRCESGTETLKELRPMTANMKVTLNGEARALACGLTVKAMLLSLGLDPAKIAVERNLEIVPRSTYDQVAVARRRPARDRAFHRRRQCACRMSRAKTSRW